MTFVRSLLYNIWFYLSLAIIGLACMPFAYFSRRNAIAAIRFWARMQRAALHIICGIRTEFRGLENVPVDAAVIAMKHQSTYDTIAPFIFLADPAFILKQELLKAPVFGVYASRSGMIPIDRGGHARTLIKMLAAAKVEAAKGRGIVIFPEGTRQDVDVPTELKPGAFAIYRALGAPCVPVALNTGLCWKGSGFTRRPGVVVFEALTPIEPGLSREVFTQRLQDALHAATAKLVLEGRAIQLKRGVVRDTPLKMAEE
jgi:1-acyl-sn-glycerol-3-phosphate acyltransferase